MTDRLEQLAAIPPRTKAAKIRAFMPAIEKRISDGVSHQAIIKWLADGGIEVTLGTFKSYLQRYRREAQTSPQSVTLIPTQAPALENTDRNTGTNPEPIEDGNPPSELPEPEPAPANKRALADILNAKKSEAYLDQFFVRKPLFGRNRDKP